MTLIEGLLTGTTDTTVPIQVSAIGAVSTMPVGHSGTPYTKFLTAAGDGTGADNLNGNYAAAATDFWFQVPVGLSFDVYSFLIQVSDNANFTQTDYGAIAGGLANGVSFWLNAGAADIPLMSGKVVNQNHDWFRVASDINLTSWSGLSQTLAVNLHLVDSFGMPLILDSGVKFIVRLNDDFTGLVYHSFCLRGIVHAQDPQHINYLALHGA